MVFVKCIVSFMIGFVIGTIIGYFLGINSSMKEEKHSDKDE